MVNAKDVRVDNLSIHEDLNLSGPNRINLSRVKLFPLQQWEPTLLSTVHPN